VGGASVGSDVGDFTDICDVTKHTRMSECIQSAPLTGKRVFSRRPSN